MSKKDYILIAKAFKNGKDREEVLQNLVEALQKDNAKFDIRKFCLACLLEE